MTFACRGTDTATADTPASDLTCDTAMHADRFRCLVSALLLALLSMVAPASAAAGEQRTWLPRHQDAAFRVVVWNVSRESFFDNAADFRRVLAAVDADLLILDEMAPGVSAEAIAAQLPPRAPGWQVAYGTGGGQHQRASIAARSPLLRQDAFDGLAYPDEAVEAWVAGVPPEHAARFRADLATGVSAVGAIVGVGGRRLLVVGLDLQCCGADASSWQEARRRIEAGNVRAAIDRVLAREAVDAVLVGGDLNVVNGSRPLDILRGPEGAAAHLRDVPAAHRGGATWTWDGRGTPFPSSRLDYVLHTDALVPLQAQVFDSEDLSAEESEALGLPPGLSRSLAEHRPVVVDFGWR